MQWLKTYPADVEEHLRMTDNEVLAAIAASARDPGLPGHDPARRIACRGHFRKIYERNALDQSVDPNVGIRSLEYGSTFEAGEQVAYLEKHCAPAIAEHRDAVAFVISHLASRGVKQLERLATALYFTVTTDDASVEGRSARIREVKPHISDDEARKAVEEVDW